MMRPGHLFALCIMGSAAGSLPLLTSKALAQPAPQPPAAYEPDMAYSGKLSYDPSTCSRDPQGMIFFALGRRVLRQPMDNLGYMMGLNAAERRVMPHTLQLGNDPQLLLDTPAPPPFPAVKDFNPTAKHLCKVHLKVDFKMITLAIFPPAGARRLSPEAYLASKILSRRFRPLSCTA